MADDQTESFIDKFYDELNGVIGGTNPDQFLCLNFPGTVLDEESFKYDARKEKPLKVAANESRLANKLFDPVKATGSDNGRTLTSQYKTALDMLSPRLNMEVMEAKSNLRKMLATPYEYNFGDGIEESTIQQVFYRLYDEWIAEKKHWAEVQTAKRRELRNLYPKTARNDTSDLAIENDENFQEDYLEWYQNNAETYLAAIEEKFGKIIGIFSVNDMRVIQGVLDTGLGAELHEARMMLANAEKLDPDGGKVYPVSFFPADWHTKLTSSFQYTDLLESKEALASKVSMLARQKRQLSNRLETLLPLLPSDEQVDKLTTAYRENKKAYEGTISEYGATTTNNFTDFAHQVVEVVTTFKNESGKKQEEATHGLNNDEQDTNKDEKTKVINNVIKHFGENQTSLLNAQHAVNVATTDLLAGVMALNEAKLGQQLKTTVRMLQNQISDVQEDLDEAKQKLALAVQVNVDENQKQDVHPNTMDNGYMEMMLASNMSEAYASHVGSSSASSSSSNGGFWFFGGSKTTSESANTSSDFSAGSNSTIEIGMAVTKVTINRPWFNPGVFGLTSDMYKSTSDNISAACTTMKEGVYQELRDCVLPVYPTAFVLAKDVTIKITNDSSMSSATSSMVEKHVSSGGGFFGFQTSSGSSSKDESSSSSVQSSGNSIIVRFAEPQIIGYYLQIVPEDKSKPISPKTEDLIGNSVSILDFINKMKDIQVQAKDSAEPVIGG
ncbi:MAG: hypothetical protein LBT37_04560 [Lactobacillaceae bacterium]|jgi:hypothetical protein|nr:hypothetical protein [Lactobacillaceae bacterium]